MNKLTKTNIEELANEIITFLNKHSLANAVSIYFNNKVVRSKGTYDEDYNYIPNWTAEEDVDPHDYFEYAAYDHILSMSFEGGLYDVLNYTFGKKEEQFRKIFEKYGLYFELGNAWNLTAYPNDDKVEIEYTKYTRPKVTINLYRSNRTMDNPPKLQEIMDKWYELSATTGDKGSFVRGAGFEFEWDDNKYFMSACSPYYRSISWETHIDTIKEMLEKAGATNIYYNWGNMD